MLNEFISLGQWWLPSNPDLVVNGRLSFSPGTGAKLELNGSFYASPFEEMNQVKQVDDSNIQTNVNSKQGVPLHFIKPEEKIILGLLDNNEQITLYRCSGSIKEIEFVSWRQNLLFNIQYIFRKVHFQKEEDVKLKSISVQYSNLEQWVGLTGLQVYHSGQGNQIFATYQTPLSIHLTKISDLNLDITFSSAGSYFNYLDIPSSLKVHLEQKTFLNIKSNICNQAIDEFIDLAISFRDLLSFAMTKSVSVISITGTADIINQKFVEKELEVFTIEEELQETQFVIMFGLWNAEEISNINIARNEMLFLFKDVKNNLGEIFKAWIEQRSTYQSVFDLLMITMYSPDLYLHYKFLNMIQALEAYHTIGYEGMYQDQKIYEKGIYKEFRKILKDFPSENDNKENGISEEFRKALLGKLKSQTRFTLETRLKQILSSLSSLLPNDFIGEDREEIARRASDTRNALTHHDKQKREKAAQGKELSQLFYTLRIILQVCLLREINIPDESIKVLIERNRERQKEWRTPSNS